MTDGRTNGLTEDDNIYRACIASRRKNYVKFRRVIFAICERTDIQANRQTCRHADHRNNSPTYWGKLLYSNNISQYVDIINSNSILNQNFNLDKPF